MDLKSLSTVFNEATILRQMIDGLDSQLSEIHQAIKNNDSEITRLKTLEKINEKAWDDVNKLKNERTEKQTELDKRIKLLEEQGIKVKEAQSFKSNRVNL